jgi:hypothetical protein
MGKGLFHTDWLGAGLAASSIGPQLSEEEMGKSSAPPPTIDVSFGLNRQVVLTLHRQNCHVIHHPPPS